jgi:hypothetical protein
VRNIIISRNAEQCEESRLKPTFCLDLLEAGVELCPLNGVFGGGFGVDEVTALTVHTGALTQKNSAFLGLVSAVGLLVFLELV